MKTKSNLAVPFRGQVTLSGVEVAWHSTKHLIADETGDWDQHGEDIITVAARDPVSADTMRWVMSRVDALDKCRRAQGRLTCPYTDAYLTVTGLDESGHVMVQVTRDNVPRGHGPAWEFGNLRPEAYSQAAGMIGMKSLAFIRDACQLLSRCEQMSLRQLEDALFSLRPSDNNP